jgi:hypothetical protein
VRERRWASAVVAATWLAGTASAQASPNGAPPLQAVAPSAAPNQAREPQPAFQDDPTESGDWGRRPAAARPRHDDWIACLAAKLPGCSPGQGDELEPDPMAQLLNDDTLVDDGVVSTPRASRSFVTVRIRRTLGPTLYSEHFVGRTRGLRVGVAPRGRAGGRGRAAQSQCGRFAHTREIREDASSCTASLEVSQSALPSAAIAQLVRGP